jgi:hypothetical protein
MQEQLQEDQLGGYYITQGRQDCGYEYGSTYSIHIWKWNVNRLVTNKRKMLCRFLACKSGVMPGNLCLTNDYGCLVNLISVVDNKIA